MVSIGVIYYEGLGVKKDYVKARNFSEKACKAGDELGCTNLGVLYLEGLGVKKDYAKARSLFEKACNEAQ